MPLSCALSTRKASDELPRSNKPTIIRKIRNGFPNPLRVILGISCAFLLPTSFAPITKDTTANKAGIRLIKTMVLKVDPAKSNEFDCANQTTRAAIKIPNIAPAVSAAR